MIRLREPRVDELPALTALCLRSKGVWGYDEAFMAACLAELTLHPDHLTTTSLQLAEDELGCVGVARIALDDDDIATIEAMFVEPDRMGCGAGRLLFQWAVERARALGASVLMIDADPRAAPFYQHMGASLVGEAPSGSIPGRMLPLLRLEL